MVPASRTEFGSLLLSGKSRAKSFRLVFCFAAVYALVNIASAQNKSAFQQLIADPKAFHGKRITLTGVAEISGAEFILYPDERAARRGAPTVSLNVDFNGKRHDYLTGHWMEVTGTVDAQRRGTFGTDVSELNNVQYIVLAKQPLSNLHVIGVFRNETSASVLVTVYRTDGHSKFEIPPGDTRTQGIDNAVTVEVRTKSGIVVAKAALDHSSKRYFDSHNRRFYYRIKRDRVETVLPKEAKGWKVFSLRRH